MADHETEIPDDLWGVDFSEDSAELASVVLLNEQASALTRRTGGRIEGVVVREFREGTIWASFYARVPALQNYMHKLVTTAYPVDAGTSNPFFLSVKDTFGTEDFTNIKGMDHFRSWLRDVLSSPEAHAVINNLLKLSSDRAAS